MLEGTPVSRPRPAPLSEMLLVGSDPAGLQSRDIEHVNRTSAHVDLRAVVGAILATKP
jgi:hypothetical protein